MLGIGQNWPKPDNFTFTTSCDSPFRINPLSIWRHLTLSFPIALKQSAAKTHESTPPEMSTRIFPFSPTCSLISAMHSSSRKSSVNTRGTFAIFKKFENISFPNFVKSTSGWNWTPKIFRFESAIAATMSPLVAIVSNPSATFVIESPCVKRTSWLSGSSLNQSC